MFDAEIVKLNFVFLKKFMKFSGFMTARHDKLLARKVSISSGKNSWYGTQLN